MARAARRARIAAALIAKTRLTDVARAENISREWASHEAHTPETQLLIAGLLDRRASEIDALLTDALDAVRDALEAEEVTHVPIQTTVTVTAAQAQIAAVPKTGTSRAIPATPGVAGSRVRDVRLVKIRKTDHYARLAAVKRLIELATAGRSLPRAADAAEAQLATLEQLETLVELSQRTQ